MDRNGSDLFKTDAVRQLNGSVISAKGHRFAIASFFSFSYNYRPFDCSNSSKMLLHLCRVNTLLHLNAFISI